MPQETAESLVTPEIERAFNETFGGTSTARAEEEAESLSSLDDATHEDTGGDFLEGDEDTGDDDDGTAGDGSSKQGKQGKKDENEAGSQESIDLPAHLLQAAKDAEWSDEQLANLYKADPKLTEDTLRRIYQSEVDANLAMARYGAAPPAPGQQSPKPKGDDGGTDIDALVRDLYTEEGVEKLKDKYGDSVLDDIVKPILGPMIEMQSKMQNSQQDSAATEVQNFFSGLGDQYADLYGKGDKISDEAREARYATCQLADQIMNGAAMQGINMSVSEALQRANMIAAMPHIQKLERKRLTDSITKRSKSRSVGTGSTAASSGPNSGQKRGDEAAMQAYADRAAELGIDI